MNKQRKERRQVVKSNSYALSQYNMSTVSQKLVNLAISEISREQINPETANLKEQISVRLTASTIRQTLGWKGHSLYTMLDEVGRELQNIKLVIDGYDENGNPVRDRVSPFSRSRYSEGYLDICFEPYMNQHLLKTAQTTRYYLSDTKNFDRKYTIRFYEVCQSILFLGDKGKEFDLEELKGIVGARVVELDEKGKNIVSDSYPRWSDFKRYAILPAQREMEQFGRLNFDFKEIKTGRRVTGVWLCAYEKEQSEVLSSENNKDNDTIPVDGISEMLFAIDECRAFLPNEMTSKDISSLLTAANYNVDLIHRKYELSKKTNIKDSLTGWLISAIKNNYDESPLKQEKKNSFQNFEQRTYDYDELERQMLEKSKI